MASLSNINGLFDVHSTGAILFSNTHGTSGQILRSNGNAAPTWVDASTVIGGPYLPLTGGTLSGPLSGTSATFSGTLTVGGNNVVGFSGSWNGADMPGSRWNGYSVNGGEVVFQRDNPNSGQMSILVDGGYYAGENNGFYSLYSSNSYNSKAGFYADTSGVLQFNAPATFTGLVSGITPTAAANFTTKDYVDSLSPPGGPYVTIGTAQTITANKTFSTLTSFTASESIYFKGARGQFTNEFMHLYNKVGIGNPAGWGQGETSTPNQGLSVYGGSNFAYGTSATSTFYGPITATGKILLNANNINFESAYSGNGLVLSHHGVGPSNAIVSGDSVYPDNLYINNGGVTSDWSNVIITGNVGIGTSTPGSKLHVQGGFIGVTTGQKIGWIYNPGSDNNMYNYILTADNGGVPASALEISGSNWTSGNVAGVKFTHVTGGEIMTIMTGGNVGIGATSPGHKLEVNGGIRAGIAGGSSGNIPGLKVYAASAQTDTTAAIAIQQGTAEGDTIIFADYEPHVEWGISAQNSTDQIHFTAGTSTNSLGTKTFYNNAGAARTAYIKFNHDLTDGTTLIGGNVGIGTTNTTNAKLNVNGQILLDNIPEIQYSLTSGGPYLNVRSRDSGTSACGIKIHSPYGSPGYIYGEGSGTAGTIMILDGAGQAVFSATQGVSTSLSVNNSTRLFINNSGNVGIGATSPQAKLDIGLGTLGNNGLGGLRIFDNATHFWMLIRKNSVGATRLSLYHGQGSVPLVFQEGGGNVGIGTTSPTSKLHVFGGSANTELKVTTNDNYIARIGMYEEEAGASHGGFIQYRGELSDRLEFGSKNSGTDTVHMSISDLYGNVGIGTAPNAGVAGDRLKIQGGNNGLGCIKAISGQYSYGVRIEGSNLSTQLACYSSSTALTTQINFETAGNSSAGKITTTGNSTAYNTLSDYRVKENVIPISDSISRLNQLKPSRFNFIGESNKTVDGFIAHEVQDIVPEAIVGEKDEIDKDGNPVHQGIDQAKLVPLLVAAIQELEARVKELENK